jgi:hypothetical protein
MLKETECSLRYSKNSVITLFLASRKVSVQPCFCENKWNIDPEIGPALASGVIPYEFLTKILYAFLSFCVVLANMNLAIRLSSAGRTFHAQEQYVILLA